jgi:hypothetical protein
LKKIFVAILWLLAVNPVLAGAQAEQAIDPALGISTL